MVRANSGGDHHLRIAAFVERTRALGPGTRAAVWVQGCPFACPGCIAPDFLTTSGGTTVFPRHLASRIARLKGLEGVTLSGGEPFAQARACADLIEPLRDRGLGVIIFSGYLLETLQRKSRRDPHIKRLLLLSDVLIDGQYLHALNDSNDLRGSSNQRTHHLTRRYENDSAFFGNRKTEVVDSTAGQMLVGVPSLRVWQAIVLEGATLTRAQRLANGLPRPPGRSGPTKAIADKKSKTNKRAI